MAPAGREVLHPAIQLLLAITALIAAITDLRFRRIPNWLTFPAMLGGFAIHSWVAGYRGALWAAAGFLLAGAVYLGLYALRAMGAGDVKLMAAAGSMLGPIHWPLLFFWSAVCGGLFALVTLLRRGSGGRALRNLGQILKQLVRFQAPHKVNSSLDIRASEAVTNPHGVAIAAAAGILLLWS